MANWYGTARSNYVRVKDLDGLTKALEPIAGSILIVNQKDRITGETLYAFLSQDQDSGDFPSSYFDHEAGDSVDFDFAMLVMPFIPVGEALILMCAGAEKMRYVTGISTAYTWKKQKNGKLILRTLQVSLDDIYHNVAKFWKVQTTTASY